MTFRSPQIVRSVRRKSNKISPSKRNKLTRLPAFPSPIEALEARTLLSSTTVSGGLMTIVGDTTTANTISVVKSGSNYVATVNGTATTYATSSVTKFNITGGSAADSISFGSDVTAPATISGNAGNDSIRGAQGADSISGQDGNDLIYGYGGADNVSGGEGHDSMYGGFGDDKINGNYGQDWAAGQDGSNTYYNTQTPNTGDYQIYHSGETNTGLKSSAGPKVAALMVVDADSDTDEQILVNNGTINLAQLGTALNVRADVSGAVRSVKLTYDSNAARVENEAPFTIASGTATGDYSSWTPSIGTHTLKVVAYDGLNATGTASATYTVTFTVVSSGSTTPPPSPDPDPDPEDPTAPPPPPVIPGTNAAPTVKITSPTSSSSTWGPAAFYVNASATDSDGSIQRVDFFNGSTYLGTAYDSPWTYAWTKVPAGSYTIKAVAYDNDGAKATSAGISVTVANPAITRTYYVSTGGSDANAGSSSAPFRTISKAAAIAKAGEQVIIRPGTYREGVTVMNSGTSTKPIIFKAETPGTVIVDGAELLTSWSKDSDTSKPIYSTNWSHDFFHDTDTGDRTWGGTDARAYAEQFVWNGKLLKRAESYSSMTAGTFTINYSTNKMSVYLPNGVAPSTGTAAGTVEQRLFFGKNVYDSSNIEVDGLIFRHAANFPQSSAVRTWDGWRLKNCVVEDINAMGVGVAGDRVWIYNVTSRNNGNSGIGGSGMSNTIIENSVTTGNNVKQYGATWESGGGKYTRVESLYIKNLTAGDNYGHNLWFDMENKNVSVVGGNFYDSQRVAGSSTESAGILIEISAGPFRIDGIKSYDNDGTGIVVAESRNVGIRNSTFSHNGLNGISLRDTAGRQYEVGNVKIFNNKIDNWISNGINLWLRTSGSSKPSARGVYCDSNVYDPSGTNGNLLRWDQSYDTLSEIRTFGIESKGSIGTINFVRPVLDLLPF
jgi:hypothetical protein